MRPKKSRKKVVAYVESYDDVLFWRMALSPFENEKRYFEVMLPSKRGLERGKKAAIMTMLAANAGNNMIACVDADMDYLLQGKSEFSKMMLSAPYVFHTYVYAIENFQCYAESLHNVAVMATLNDKRIFDFPRYLHEISRIIHPLFVWMVLFYRRGEFSRLSITDFNSCIRLGHFSISDVSSNIARLRNNIERKLTAMRNSYPTFIEEHKVLSAELETLGVTPDNTYLYIQGHFLFDIIVTPAMKCVCDRLRRMQENEIHKTSVHHKQEQNELSCYSHSIENITSMLKKNIGYVMSDPYLRIYNDLKERLG